MIINPTVTVSRDDCRVLCFGLQARCHQRQLLFAEWRETAELSLLSSPTILPVFGTDRDRALQSTAHPENARPSSRLLKRSSLYQGHPAVRRAPGQNAQSSP